MRYSVVPSAARPHGAELRSPTSAGYDGWAPAFVLGAPAPGGLMLPPAHPTAAWLYGPRAVWVDDDLVIVADTGNHRVLIWHGVPDTDGAPADVVLGQPDETSEGPAAAGRGPENGMHLPTGILRDGERLVIADAWHHRLLIWEQIPRSSDVPPDLMLGQPDASSVQPNAGREAPGADTFYWPFGVALIDGRLHVADTGNRRVLIWRDGIPTSPRPADVVLGQPTGADREENRGGEVAADSFRWPHAFAPLITDTGQRGVWVADAGNHRVLGWSSHPDHDRPADRVLGQPDFATGTEFPYVSQENRLRFPYGLTAGSDASGQPGPLVLADTANNRVLLQSGALDEWRPGTVLAQPDLAANGENRWAQVDADTLCWPYGVHWHGAAERELIAVADSGNNRVVVWEKKR